jgi:hypothetical protein
MPTLSAHSRRKHDSSSHRGIGAVKAEAAKRARDRARLDGADDTVHLHPFLNSCSAAPGKTRHAMMQEQC